MMRSWGISGLSLVALCGACTDPASPPAPAALPATSAAVTPSPPFSAPARLTAPKEVRGELFRTTYTDARGFSDNASVLSDEPRPGVTYQLYAACTATAPGRKLTFSVGQHKKEPVVSGDLPCDGEPTSVDGLSDLPGGSVRVTLDGDHEGITSSYAILRPQKDE